MPELKKQYLPGSTSEIIRHMRCEGCGHEFDVQVPEASLEDVVCEECGTPNPEVKYIMFPADGPGFDKDYAKLGLS